MALGASVRELQARILYETLRLAAVGILIRYIAALGLGRTLISLTVSV